MSRKTLLFVTTRFLFPVDSGGKIRTTQILRGLKELDYKIILVGPATAEELVTYASEIASVTDRCMSWTPRTRGPLFYYTRSRYGFNSKPIPVCTDWSPEGAQLIRSLLEKRPDVVVFDFLHAAILAPQKMNCPSVIFTHNVEAEIFARHIETSSNWFLKQLWSSQYRKMVKFEKSSLARFDTVVAVSNRDNETFSKKYGISDAHVIPTGVDLNFFEFHKPSRSREVVFYGSMDWLANQDGISYYIKEIWPLIKREVKDARMTVIGRSPPRKLVKESKQLDLDVRFTGFVEDIRDYSTGAAVSVIPLRVGGGTRLKAYEAMAMGNPIVSTSIGMEGLPVKPGVHFVEANSPQSFARSVVALLHDGERRNSIATTARKFVEDNFSYTVAATSFAAACDLARQKYNNSSAV